MCMIDGYFPLSISNSKESITFFVIFPFESISIVATYPSSPSPLYAIAYISPVMCMIDGNLPLSVSYSNVNSKLSTTLGALYKQ